MMFRMILPGAAAIDEHFASFDRDPTMKAARTQDLIAAALAAFALFGAVSPALAQGTGGANQATESSVTVYGGYRTSNQLTETTTGRSVDVDDGASYAVALDIGIDRKKQVEIFYSRQNTKLTSGGFSAAVNNVPLTIEYLHIGGTYFLDGLGHGGYVVGGIGATLLRPDRAGLDSETKPSINLGVGYMLPVGKNFGLRFELRGYATLLNNSNNTFCGNNGSCVVSIKGTALYQGEALIGLSGRF
jgi:hypothetical protein